MEPRGKSKIGQANSRLDEVKKNKNKIKSVFLLATARVFNEVFKSECSFELTSQDFSRCANIWYQ